jgi:KaiC/GvpD/RAD55 family RecA-like ATPase
MSAAASPYLLNDYRDYAAPPKGWDAADALQDGWTRDDVAAFIQDATEDYLPDVHSPEFSLLDASGSGSDNPRPATPLDKNTPFRSKFGALYFEQIFTERDELEYLVKGVVTRGEVSMLVGPSQSGKSFFATDMALRIARGEPFLTTTKGATPRTKRGGVVYIAGEGGRGLKRRIKAHVKYYGITSKDFPYVLIPQPVDFATGKEQTDFLIEETKHYSSVFKGKHGVGVELLVVDTFSSTTAGANENSSEDVSRILGRMHKVARECGCAVMIVHHMNASGTRERGHSSLRANVDSVIEVVKSDSNDHEGRLIRKAKVTKQKDGEDGTTWNFVLCPVVLGLDEDGEEIKSCVIRSPAGNASNALESEEQSILGNTSKIFFDYLEETIDKHGVSPPYGIGAPSYVKAVTLQQWREVMQPRVIREGESEDDLIARIQKARNRVVEVLLSKKLIEKSGEYVWRTTNQPFRKPAPTVGEAKQTASYSLTKDGFF